MLGYKFTTEEAAQAAVAQCDAHYGYPKQDCVTQHWCSYEFSNLDNFYYISHDESIEVVLGTSEEFTLTQPEGLDISEGL
jgi:hypothetical protein